MDEPSMRFVVEGDGPDRSGGLVWCSVVQTDRYDHKRHHKEKGAWEDIRYKMWDIIVWRADGTCVALHPAFSSTKITCIKGIPKPDLEVPMNGPGGSNGKRTFRRFKSKQVENITF